MKRHQVTPYYYINFSEYDDFDNYPQLESANEDKIEEEIRSAMEDFVVDDKYRAAQTTQEKQCRLIRLSSEASSLTDTDHWNYPKLECKNEENVVSLIAAAISDIDKWAKPDPEWDKQNSKTEETETFDLPYYRKMRINIGNNIKPTEENCDKNETQHVKCRLRRLAKMLNEQTLENSK